jgi:hypothetical protein
VTPKIPTGVKVAGALVLIGGGVAAASGGGSKSPDDGVSVDSEIVTPELPK